MKEIYWLNFNQYRGKGKNTKERGSEQKATYRRNMRSGQDGRNGIIIGLVE